MKRLILVLSLATVALSGCAQLKDWYYDTDANAPAGASGVEETRPYPKSSSDLGLG